ncbi:hypothetical protein DPMN_166370 [Dreissena polymorpha]|uniref:Uncharacterized protein n=1 Tax=Dreissena polymorpha TaxID=45954 RepID=A0A9D4F233_DREPO|nr:hypothetical protein DPMN_166370 [Dreissena polymorpha]
MNSLFVLGSITTRSPRAGSNQDNCYLRFKTNPPRFNQSVHWRAASREDNCYLRLKSCIGTRVSESIAVLTNLSPGARVPMRTTATTALKVVEAQGLANPRRFNQCLPGARVPTRTTATSTLKVVKTQG